MNNSPIAVMKCTRRKLSAGRPQSLLHPESQGNCGGVAYIWSPGDCNARQGTAEEAWHYAPEFNGGIPKSQGESLPDVFIPTLWRVQEKPFGKGFSENALIYSPIQGKAWHGKAWLGKAWQGMAWLGEAWQG